MIYFMENSSVIQNTIYITTLVFSMFKIPLKHNWHLDINLDDSNKCLPNAQFRC